MWVCGWEGRRQDMSEMRHLSVKQAGWELILATHYH